MDNIIIVGIGNQYRGDDGAGWAVIDGLPASVGSSIKLVKLRGDIAALIEIFSSYAKVYVVDACLGSSLVGTWQRIDLHQQAIPNENPQTSTHGFGLSQAISIAKNLDQLPEKLILYALSGDTYGFCDTLSPPVVKSVDQVIQAILNEEDIRSCMNRAL